jgi:hypothetical protein
LVPSIQNGRSTAAAVSRNTHSNTAKHWIMTYTRINPIFLTFIKLQSCGLYRLTSWKQLTATLTENKCHTDMCLTCTHEAGTLSSTTWKNALLHRQFVYIPYLPKCKTTLV